MNARQAAGLLLTIGLMGTAPNARAATEEKNLLLLHNGGVVVGILPEVGGRVMLFRTDTGENVLDSSPELWDTVTPEDKAALVQKSYHGESVWSGPQAIWSTDKEPYPPSVPKAPNGGQWPPDPAWEMAPFTVLEKSTTRAVLRGPVSKLNGMELTKTMELLPDGRFKFSVSAVNRGGKIVENRDLWVIVRPPPSGRCFLPIKPLAAENGFKAAVSQKEADGLTVMELAPRQAGDPLSGGKLRASATGDWIASALPGCFLTVRFHPADPAKTVPSQAPVEVYYASEPRPLCELERHGEAHTLKPGEAMTWEETWQIVPYTGPPTAEAQAKFLQVWSARALGPAAVD